MEFKIIKALPIVLWKHIMLSETHTYMRKYMKTILQFCQCSDVLTYSLKNNIAKIGRH